MSNKFLYHGSSVANIKILKPQIRFAPSTLGKKVLPAIYASKNKGYSACHSFSWSTEEGFNLYVKNKKVFLRFRKNLKIDLKNKYISINFLEKILS